jgi:glycosyltransferase involved in cell wall biosynthesis
LPIGVPVLSHELGDISKLVRGGATGYLLNYGDFQDFMNKLQLAINNREELSRNSYVQAQKYSVENVTNMICNAMEEVVR